MHGLNAPTIDLLITLGLGLFTAFIALLGGLVGTNKPTYRWLFYISAAVLAILSVVGGFRQYDLAMAPILAQENVESNIKKWLDEFGFVTTVVPDAPGLSYFTLAATSAAKQKFIISRPRDPLEDQNITIMAFLSFDTPDVKALSKADSAQLVSELRLEMFRSKVKFLNITDPLTVVTLSERVPIAGLTKDTFLTHLDNVDAAKRVTTEITQMAVRHSAHPPQ